MATEATKIGKLWRKFLKNSKFSISSTIQCSKYHGEVVLIKGWKPKDDDVYDRGLIEMV
jgi:hypothetical protein